MLKWNKLRNWSYGFDTLGQRDWEYVGWMWLIHPTNSLTSKLSLPLYSFFTKQKLFNYHLGVLGVGTLCRHQRQVPRQTVAYNGPTHPNITWVLYKSQTASKLARCKWKFDKWFNLEIRQLSNLLIRCGVTSADFKLVLNCLVVSDRTASPGYKFHLRTG